MTPMFDVLKALDAYTRWADARILAALPDDAWLKEVGGSFGTLRNTAVHLVSAQWIWLSRWKGSSPSGHLKPEDFATPHALRERAETLGREIARYDAADAAEVSRRVRASAGLDLLVEEVVGLYREVLAEHARGGAADALAEARAAADFVRSMGLAAKREAAEFRAELLASSLTLRLRNQMPRFPLLERAVRRVARAARRCGL